MAGLPETEECSSGCRDDQVFMEFNDGASSQDLDQNSSKNESIELNYQ